MITQTEATFEGWCIVELFGHQQIAGKVSEKSMFGTSLMRIDVPAVNGRPAFTKFYGGGAIYAITPVQEAVARAMAAALDEPPIQEWRLKTVDVARQLPEPVGIEDGEKEQEAEHEEESTRHIIHRVERFVSKSGNDSWKAHDSAGTIIYLRQVHREMLVDAGLWEQLNAMPVGFGWEADITLYTVPDGDFLKPVRFEPGGWVQESAEQRDGRAKAKGEAAEWARNLLAAGNFVIFDTEATGVGENDEIIQIGIIDQDGNIVLDQLIKPDQPILNSHYHGITDDMVEDAPPFSAVYQRIKEALDGKIVVAYNFEYDNRMLQQNIAKYGPEYAMQPITFAAQHCAMNWYAQFNGEWDDYHGNYRWVKLREALAAFGLKHEDFGTKEHDACTDARATLALIRKMAESEDLPF